MSNLKGITFEQGNPSGNTLLSEDGISGLVISAQATTSLAINTPKELNTLKDAEDLGFTEKYDKDNNLNVHRHISEYYRLAGSTARLYIMIADQSRSLADIVEHDTKQLLIDANGTIKQLAFATNLQASATVTLVDGLPDTVNTAIPKAQGLADWAAENQMECNIFIEGHHYGGNASASGNLRAITNVSAPNVSVFIGQDYDHAEQRADLAQKYADVGTLLGQTSAAKVHQNVGNNEEFNISSNGHWVTPGLSSHQTNKQAFSDLQTLEDKGYVFGVTYSSISGVRINNDHTCVEVKVDTNNVTNAHSIALGRTLNKARRGLRAVYMPKVKTDWFVDAKTGKLAKGTIVALEDIGDKVFEFMQGREEISYGKVTVDPDSDLIGDKKLKFSFVIVPKGTIGEINGTITLKTKE